MSNHETKLRGMNMNAIAAAQSILHLPLIFGQGIADPTGGDEAAYVINNIPVSHAGINLYTIETDVDKVRLSKWGEFTHPYLMVGMPSVSGKVRLMISLVNNTNYVLVMGVQLNEDQHGPSYPYWQPVCWTPRQKNDSKLNAGERMFHALLMHMFSLESESDTYDNEDDIEFEWMPSKNCLPVFEKIFENH